VPSLACCSGTEDLERTGRQGELVLAHAPLDAQLTDGARERAALTQEALRLRASFHPTEVNRIERGRRNPGLLTIVKLAQALGVPAGNLLAGL